MASTMTAMDRSTKAARRLPGVWMPIDDGYFSAAGCNTAVDCNDLSASQSPGDPEVCGNGIDDDCDGENVDEALDADGDGWSTCTGDCNDNNVNVNPGAFEIIGNGIDDNCNATIDEAAVACATTVKLHRGHRT